MPIMWSGRPLSSSGSGYTAATAPIGDIPPWVRERATPKADPNGNRQQRRTAARRNRRKTKH